MPPRLIDDELILTSNPVVAELALITVAVVVVSTLDATSSGAVIASPAFTANACPSAASVPVTVILLTTATPKVVLERPVPCTV